MKKQNYIVGVIIIALLGALFIYLSNRNSSYEWHVNLREDAYQPYDLGFFRDVLDKTFEDDFELIKRSSQFELAADSGKGTMLYVEDGIRLTDDHREKLLSFIERGNTAIFSSDILPEALIDDITGVDFDIEYSSVSPDKIKDKLKRFAFENEELEISDYILEGDEEDIEDFDYTHNLYLKDSIVSVNFLDNPDKRYTFKFIQKDTIEQYTWHGIDSILFDDFNSEDDFTPISLLNDSLIYYFSMNYGEGKLYVHMNPILFSNIYFKEKSGFSYANRILENFSEGKVYYNQHYTYFSTQSDYSEESQTSPLTFILKHRSLKWTLYLILGLSLVYMIFSFKRRLPVIPFFAKPKNTSISYVKALSSFYLSAKNHALLGEEMMVNFKHYLRTRYRLNTNLEKEELIPLISRNSGISILDITAIFDKEFEINFSDKSKSKGLVDLYKLLESFYSNCK